MEVKFTIEFKEAKRYQINMMEAGGLIIHFKEAGVYPGKCIAFAEIENGYRGMDILHISEIKEILVYDIRAKKVKNWVELKSITLEAPSYYREIPERLFQRFIMRDLYINGTHMSFTEDVYQKFASYVREQDIVENLKKAIYNNMPDSCFEEVIKHLLENVEKNPKPYCEIFRHVFGYSGEDELTYINAVVNEQGGMSLCTLISNEGTENEMKTEAYLMNEQAERYSKFISNKKKDKRTLSEQDITVPDLYGNTIDLFYVDTIIVEKRNVEVMWLS